MSKKVSVAGIVLLFIFSVITPLVVGYDVEIDEDMFKENFLTDDFNEPEDLTHRICGEDYGKATSMKSLNEAHLFQQENDIDLSMGELLEFRESSDLYSYLMKTDDGQDGEEYDSYKEVVNYPLENSTICGYVIDNITEDPIEGARVIIFWSGNRGIDVNYTYSDSLGFYSINIEISVPIIVVRASEYFSESISISNSEENETLWFNVSLDPGTPPENSVICGYITDNVADDPIDGADIIQVYYDASMYYDWNYTCTNSSGFYSVNIAAGDILLYSDADGYYGDSVAKYDISENETLWINLSLVPLPPENSTVCGYITDNVTENPIENAYVSLNWHDGHFYQNYTFTNSSGFYSMNVAAGEIDLYAEEDRYFGEHTGDYDIGENETLWVNISLYPIPSENSVVCGYVTDETTGTPIENARVGLHWNDDQDHNVWDDTSTDSSGFYRMNVAAGEINIDVEADEYLEVHTESYDIGEYESLEINITMQFIINENSVVCGYITDVETDYPIIDAYVSLHWHDDRGHFYWKYTFADSSGFYEMNVASGEVCIHAYAYEYLCKYTEDYEIGEYDTLWVNVPMQREVIEVNIVKPQKALYVANYRVLPLLFKSIIYGSIDIEVDASDDTSFVEFRVDGKIRTTDDSEPYTWTWDTRTLLKHRHIIEVVAYGRFGSSATDEITVWKFF